MAAVKEFNIGMKKFKVFYTFFSGGSLFERWTEVEAYTRRRAIEIVRQRYPLRKLTITTVES